MGSGTRTTTAGIGVAALVACLVTGFVLDGQEPEGLAAPTGGSIGSGSKDPTGGDGSSSSDSGDAEGAELVADYKLVFPLPAGAVSYTPDSPLPDHDYYRLAGNRDSAAALKEKLVSDLTDLGYEWDHDVAQRSGPEPLTETAWNGQVHKGDELIGDIRVELFEEQVTNEADYIMIQVGYR